MDVKRTQKDVVWLPSEPIHRITSPLARFLKIEAAAGALLLLATVFALVAANSPWSGPFFSFWHAPISVVAGPFSLQRSLLHWINDGLMTLFFFLIALELKRELVLGELRNRKVALLPLAGALGGMVVPALVYVGLMKGRPEAHGWGIVVATDTAFVIGCLALLGSRVPSSLRLFLLSLAIFDDVGAILVVALGYGSALAWIPLALGALIFGMIVSASRLGIRSVPVYSILGAAAWLCMDASGIHATITGVLLGLMTPTTGWVSDKRLRALFGKVLSYPEGEHWSGDTADRLDLQRAGIAARETLSPLERLEFRLHPWVGFMVMPVFALANAGVAVSDAQLGHSVSLAIGAGLALGKPVGVFVLSWLSVRLGLAALFPGLSWPVLAAGSLLTGIGFTMSIFIASLALPANLQAEAKIGILSASVVAALAGILALLFLTSGKSKAGWMGQTGA